MSAVRMDGKALSAKVRGSILAETEELKKKGVTPGLAVIIVGNDPASEIYVRNKERACEQCGFYSEKYALPEETSQEELLGLIAQLNESPQISGILCQMPVPKHISEQAVIDAIDPRKDVDAFHPVNVGKIMVGNFDFVPCTPAGVMELLDEYQIDPRGKECVVVGRSNIVGKPMAMLLLHRHGTVTICHSRTQDLAEVCRRADILVAAVGKAGFITPDMVKEGAVVIDVGINRNAEGKVCGDVAPEVMDKASYMTPVPGGAGPMTIRSRRQSSSTTSNIKQKAGKPEQLPRFPCFLLKIPCQRAAFLASIVLNSTLTTAKPIAMPKTARAVKKK